MNRVPTIDGASPIDRMLVQHGAAAVLSLPSHWLDATGCASVLDHILRWGRSADVYAVVLRLQLGDEVASPRSNMDFPTVPHPTTAPTLMLAERLSLIWRIECLPKPMISLLDGLATDAAIGLSTFGTHRVAGDAYRLQLPAVDDMSAAPAAGIAHTLARVPHARGRDWALTARSVGRGEAYAAGLVTHCIPSAAFPAIIAALARGQPVDPLLDGLHCDPLSDAGAPDDAATARCFGHPSVDQIVAALTRETGRHAAWAAAAATAIARRLPLSRAGLLRLIDTAATCDIRDSLITTYRLACGRIEAAAALNASNSDLNIERLFATPKSGELSLPRRKEIENERF